VFVISISHIIFMIANILIIAYPPQLSDEHQILVPILLLALFFSLYASSIWPALTIVINGGDKNKKDKKSFG